jgi:5-formyltetrahydrofolate cyclo-ligase
MASETKPAIRKRVRRRIADLPAADRAAKSRAACERLYAVPELAAAETVLMYVPLPDELDVWPALRAFADAGKRLVLPRCREATHEVDCIAVGDLDRDLARGTFGIAEPVGDERVVHDALDAVVSPGRAFDPCGNRVGRGAGYYDRFFKTAGFRAFVCGIAYDCQVFAALPSAPHDVPVGAVVTESRFVRAGAWC